MADKTWKFSQRAAATAVSLLLGTAAEAGLVRGSLDPLATVDIPAYNGFADFQVDDNCLIGDGWKQTGTGSGDCGAVFMQSATIYLYGNTPSDPPGTPGTELGQVNFGAFPASEVFGILTLGGQVLGIDSAIMGAAPANGTYAGQDFWLQFVTGCEFGDSSCGNLVPDILSLLSPLGVGPFPAADPLAYLYDTTCSIDGDVEFCFPGANPSRTTPGGLVFVAIPEPGTMSLLLSALGLGWLSRRRAKKSAA